MLHNKDKYKRIGKFAVHCSLSQIKPRDSESLKWSRDVIKRFETLVLNKQCTFTTRSKLERTYAVDMLQAGAINVAEELIKERLAIRINETEMDMIQRYVSNAMPAEKSLVERFSNNAL